MPDGVQLVTDIATGFEQDACHELTVSLKAWANAMVTLKTSLSGTARQVLQTPS